MTRVTIDRSVIRAEVERRKSDAAKPEPAAPAAPAAPATAAARPRRWSARVLVVPAALAGALIRMAARATHNAMSAAEAATPAHRRRGVYIWRSTDVAAAADDAEQLLAMPDVSTAELEIARLKGKALH